MTKADKAKELFLSGYNCTQSVAGAFCEDLNLNFEDTIKMVSPFGGGMGRLREVCGAVSGMFFIVGVLYGYNSPTDISKKRETYKIVQTLAARFREKTGSIVCRELLDKSSAKDTCFEPSPRTQEYYAKRSCADHVYLAAEILENFIAEKEKSFVLD